MVACQSGILRHQTRGGQQDDSDKLGDNGKWVPECFVVLFVYLVGCCGEEGFACDKEQRNDEKDVETKPGADLASGPTVAIPCKRR